MSVFAKGKVDEHKSIMSKVLGILSISKEKVEAATDEEPPSDDPADKFKKVLVTTIVRWASESFIESPVLIREMFRSAGGLVNTLHGA